MGLFDGYDRSLGSTAQIAEILDIPVLIVVGARSTAYSVASQLVGIKSFRPGLKIAGVVFNQVASARHRLLLEQAADCPEPLPEGLDANAWEKLDARHHALWSEARERHLNDNREMVGFRRESLEASHRARVAQLEDIIGKVQNEKVLRMRRAQLEAAQADFERRMRELDEAKDKADIDFEPVAYGLIHITGGTE